MKYANRFSVTLAMALLLGSFLCSPTAYAEPAAPKSVDELLDRVEQSIKDLPAYSFDFDININVDANGSKQSIESEFDVKIERPSRWAVIKQSGPFGATSISNGKEETVYLPMLKAYIVRPLAEATGENNELASLPVTFLGPAGKVPALMGEGLKKLILDGASESKLAGEEEIDGVACWKCEFKQEGLNSQLWVTKADHPLPRRVVLVPDDSSKSGMPKGMSLTAQIDIVNFNAEPKFTDEDFKFTPPEGVRQADSLQDAMPKPGPQPPHELVGKQAPTFEVDVLDGEAFKLEDVLGKKVVMLDFWATWCGPCVAALPEISAAAEEMKEKDVVFYTVNLREEPEAVKEFLKEQELDVPVLLDAEGEIGDLYKAEAIPQTVLIGKDGRVQVVHVGFGGDAKKKLIEEMTALLEGKELAQETLDKWEAEQKKAEAEEEAEESEGDDAEGEGADVEVEQAEVEVEQ
ncbi:redoxin domain-containing protein [Lacipirellula parvula]|uniref:Thioredoxin domain-containing protein n=1 Tax=Lacipirellula parvula TaxID=2650471 RepID=A0A5K7XCM4_9BACT|nr:redoxin domain-containing protein [Lacipirellula parvula]BBO32581.1 hypothetical protein PLANPX_2193 [Lacipirellula parvula]